MHYTIKLADHSISAVKHTLSPQLHRVWDMSSMRPFNILSVCVIILSNISSLVTWTGFS